MDDLQNGSAVIGVRGHALVRGLLFYAVKRFEPASKIFLGRHLACQWAVWHRLHPLLSLRECRLEACGPRRKRTSKTLNGVDCY